MVESAESESPLTPNCGRGDYLRGLPMDIYIRGANSSDIDAMHDIRLAVYENKLNDRGAITPASYQLYINNRSAFLAESNNVILGFAIADAAIASVWALFVSPSAEGLGVGRALHDALLKWGKERGIAQLSLTTSAGTRAERFYKELGWSATGINERGEVSFIRETNF